MDRRKPPAYYNKLQRATGGPTRFARPFGLSFVFCLVSCRPPELAAGRQSWTFLALFLAQSRADCVARELADVLAGHFRTVITTVRLTPPVGLRLLWPHCGRCRGVSLCFRAVIRSGGRCVYARAAGLVGSSSCASQGRRRFLRRFHIDYARANFPQPRGFGLQINYAGRGPYLNLGRICADRLALSWSGAASWDWVRLLVAGLFIAGLSASGASSRAKFLRRPARPCMTCGRLYCRLIY